MSDFFKHAFSTPLAVAAIVAVVGVLFGRIVHDFASGRKKETRPALMLSVINASLLVLIWCCETAFQRKAPIATLLMWTPPLVLLVPAAALAVFSLVKKSRSGLCTNIASIAFVLTVAK